MNNIDKTSPELEENISQKPTAMLTKYWLYIYLVLIVYVIADFFVLSTSDNILDFAIREDMFFESLTAIALLCISITFILIFRKDSKQETSKASKIRKIGYLITALIFFIGAGEEISWGQRIFKIETPESIAAINTQEEITLHNIKFLSRNGILDPGQLFTLFMLGYTLGVPVLSLLSKRIRQFFEYFMPVIPWILGLSFLANYIMVQIIPSFVADGYTYTVIPLKQGIAEIKEANYAVLFFFVSLYILFEMINTSNSPAVQDN